VVGRPAEGLDPARDGRVDRTDFVAELHGGSP
jgi:hypothetical protein